MAYKTNELYNETVQAKLLRFVPKDRLNKTLDGLAGPPTLEFGTMLAFNTSTNFWEPWAPAGLNDTGVCRGFLMEKVIADATDETLIDVMLSGTLHRDDVPLNGETQGDVDTELKIVKTRGPFIVQGLKEVR